MSNAVEDGAVERFRSAIARVFGLRFDDSKLGFLADLLLRRVELDEHGYEAYLARLEAKESAPELDALAQELTVPETYFFRHSEQFRAFSEVVLAERLRARGSAKRLRILCAGCASGEEAYSLAILTHELASDPSWDVSILGVDVNPAALQKAGRAQYSAWAMRATPLQTQRRWFHARGTEWALDDAVRRTVRFEQRNLANANPELWAPGSYEVVFCRNVMMYFTPEAARALVARMTTALAPAGFLFLGYAETLRSLSSDFRLLHTHGTFYYRRKDEIEAPRAQPMAETPPLALVLDSDQTWVEIIRRASERIRALTEVTQPGAAASPPAKGSAPGHCDLTPALELLRKERYAQALEVTQGLAPESTSDPDVLLLRAVLLAHGGQLARAEEISLRLLDVDELNPGAHYVLALCREGAGDRGGATEQDQVAIYLDSSFAMPWLHLGLLARQAQDRDAARRDFGQAIGLLELEEPARLLLFGGGFGRRGLIALCRSELLACGGVA